MQLIENGIAMDTFYEQFSLTVITPSLIVFLFRITIPMGFRKNFFGMAVERRRPRFFSYFTHLRVNEIYFPSISTVLSGIKCNR